jgi:hypothetical protein
VAVNIVQLEHFAGRVNEGFEVDLGTSAVAMTLVEAKPLPVNPFPGMLRNPFALLFNSSSPVLLPQRIYRMKNATLGVLEMFIVPVARNKDGIVYQAVFN